MTMHFLLGELFPISWHCSNCLGPKEEELRGKQAWCKACKREYRRKYGKKYCDLSDEEKKKANARSYANVYQRRGFLVPEPCEECGAEENVEKHHENYDEPLNVKWLCRSCHDQVHLACGS